MANTLTLGQLMTQVRSRADILPQNYTPATTQSVTLVSDQELITYINQSYQELYDLLVQKYGDDYFVAPPIQFQLDGVNAYYPLPDGTLYSGAPAFQKLLGVDLIIAPGQGDSAITIKPFNIAERNRYAVPNFQSFYGVTNLRYRLYGSKIWLTPIPAAGQTLQIIYIPELTQLVAVTDIADNLGGWLEYVICDAAIKCMQKEESDVSVLMAQKMALTQRIEAAAENRDAGMPQTVSDVRNSDWFNGGFGGGFSGY